MKYRMHYSKTASHEDAAKNAHMSTLPDVIYIASSKKPVNKSLSAGNPSDVHMASIIRYLHGHKNTQLATLSMSEAGIGAMRGMQKEFDLAGDELLRMEDESGTPLNAAQTSKVSSYFMESQIIEKALRTAEKKPLLKIQTEIRNDNNHCMT